MKTHKQLLTELHLYTRENDAAYRNGLNGVGLYEEVSAALGKGDVVAELVRVLKNILIQYENVRAAEGYPEGDSVSMKQARAAIKKVTGQ